ncbi:fork head domain-containing protein [Pseudoneurospora amorphoporcata]|uniref:Fork head domain-containing protein n=1 Tax=Pseudoneurospora amorphoporcata TaxID=241081 RepID=A0AAN6P0D5_9PEZI|nr:fork head domain-containing protein [Pseudoneurospora amorphoporcata]
MSPSPPKHMASFNTADQQNLSDPVTGDSSPSRPSKRRKKDDDAPTDLADEADSSLVADQSALDMNDDDQVVARVIQYLEMPKNVQASKDHSNSIHESSQGVQAFAKIAAFDWTYYITSLTVNIGRSSEPIQGATGQSQEEDPSKMVHIDLGPNKQVSRQHALIYFKATEEQWWLRVKGRNALKVDGVPWKVGDEGPLRSGEVIEIGGMEMMFVLPADISPLQIKRDYLERAGIVLPDSHTSRQARHPLPSVGESHAFQAVSPTSQAAPRNQGPQKTLAPAPPDYRRGITPPLNLPRPPMHRTVHEGLAGPLVMTNNEVDLSLDENQHIKPQFSYAQMITQAIMNTEDQKLNLSGIYQFIMNRYSYYRHQPAGGWQNSIRHNLSLNKSFEKVARSTDEPGKGMKWQIVADARDDMIRNAYRGGRGGHRGTSNPASPSALNYITQGPKDMAAKEPPSSRKRKISPSGSPQPQPHPTIRDSQSTPVRAAQRKPLPDKAEDGTEAASPLSTIRKPATTSTSGIVEDTPVSPTLGSSYLQEDGASLVTPAPNRVNPRLVPPSTAQRPSQHMPTSSPAPFWRYADISSTPLKSAQYDASPSKTHGNLPSQSSSPPPPARSKSPAGSASPTRTTSRGATVGVEEPPSPAEEEDRAFDLTKGFQSIGSYHAPVSRGKEVQPATHGDVPSVASLSS